LGGLSGAEKAELDIWFELENVGNEYQGDISTFTMEFSLVQS
jgi:hypothetical protein